MLQYCYYMQRELGRCNNKEKVMIGKKMNKQQNTSLFKMCSLTAEALKVNSCF